MKYNSTALMCLLPLLILTVPSAEAQSTQKMCEVRDHRSGKTVVRKVPCRTTTVPPRRTPPPRTSGAATAPSSRERPRTTQKMCEVHDHRSGKRGVRKVPCRTTTVPPRRTPPPLRGGTSTAPSSRERPRKVVVIGPPDAASLLKVLKQENWIGRYKSAPARLSHAHDPSSGSLKSITTVLADNIELRNLRYQVKRGTSPRNVLLIADRIRITGSVTFDLSGWNQGESQRGSDLIDRSGGDLVLLARTLECAAGGKLELRSAGGNIPAPRTVVQPATPQTAPRTVVQLAIPQTATRMVAQPATADPLEGVLSRLRLDPRPLMVFRIDAGRGAGHGGDLIVAAERFLIGDRVETWERAVEVGCLRLTAPGGSAGSGIPVGEAGEIRHFNSFAAAVTALEQAPLKNYASRDYQPAVSRWARQTASKWVLESLAQAIADVRAADLTTGNIEALRRLRSAVELANVELYPVRPEDRPAYEERLVKLQDLRDRFASGLWHNTVAVGAPGGVPRDLELFTEGRDLRTRAAPTEALLRTSPADGRQVLGLIEFDPEQPNLLRLELEVQFTVDPWLASLAAGDLAARGGKYGGAFANWTLAPRPLSARGIRDSQVEVWPSGDGARVLLTVESDLASLVMSRLASRSGLPLDFSWEYRDDRNLSGPWRGPALSLLRRAEPELAVGTGGTLTNRAGIEVTVEYFEIGGEYHALDPAVSLAPGQSVALPLPEGADASGLHVPPEAVVFTGMDPFRLDGDFKIVNGEELIERVAVTNLLGFDELRGGALEYVEVELAYGVGEAATAVAGPYRLAPFGAEGSEINFSFVKSQRGSRRLLVSGAAYYEGGGCQTLTSTAFGELSVKITASMLPSLDAEPADSSSRCPSGI